MIHTNVLNIALTTLNLLIDPKDMASPSGSAHARVIANMRHVVPNPPSSVIVTLPNKLMIQAFLKKPQRENPLPLQMFDLMCVII